MDADLGWVVCSVRKTEPKVLSLAVVSSSSLSLLTVNLPLDGGGLARCMESIGKRRLRSLFLLLPLTGARIFVFSSLH